MATWSSAFAVAFKILVMSIVWYIVGIIVIAMGASAMGPALQSLLTSMTGPSYGTPSIDLPAIITGLVLIFVGFIITALGSIATFLKYSAEYYAREILRAPSIPPPP